MWKGEGLIVIIIKLPKIYADVAQLVEHFLGKEEVSDSSSLVSSMLV